MFNDWKFPDEGIFPTTERKRSNATRNFVVGMSVATGIIALVFFVGLMLSFCGTAVEIPSTLAAENEDYANFFRQNYIRADNRSGNDESPTDIPVGVSVPVSTQTALTTIWTIRSTSEEEPTPTMPTAQATTQATTQTTTQTSVVTIAQSFSDECTLKNTTQTSTITVTVTPIETPPVYGASIYYSSPPPVAKTDESSSLTSESVTEVGTPPTQFTTINVPWGTGSQEMITVTSTHTVQRTVSTTVVTVTHPDPRSSSVLFQSSADGVVTTAGQSHTVVETVTTTAGEAATSTTTVYLPSSYQSSNVSYGYPPVVVSGGARVSSGSWVCVIVGVVLCVLIF